LHDEDAHVVLASTARDGAPAEPEELDHIAVVQLAKERDLVGQLSQSVVFTAAAGGALDNAINVITIVVIITITIATITVGQYSCILA
jgi:hypothetical protein